MSSNNTPKSIFLIGRPKAREGLAGAAGILPGMLVEGIPAGGEVVVHATAGGVGAPAFARPNEVIGHGIDVAYADNDTVLYGVSSPGDVVYGYIADGENITAGDYLQSDGAGAFEALVAGVPGTTLPGIALVKALETIDNSAGGAIARMKLEVI